VSQTWISSDLVGSSTTVVAFGGVAGELTVPMFEFFKSLNKYCVNKIFVRDLNRTWYFGLNHNEVERKLRELIPDDSRTVFVGSSAGGFAAVLFGNKLKADFVVAFSPQTFLDSELRSKYNDNRWSVFLDKLNKQYSSYNLRLWNLLNNNNITRYYIYYCASHLLDVIHAKILVKNCNLNIKLVPIKCNVHEVVRVLKVNGELDFLFKEFIGEDL